MDLSGLAHDCTQKQNIPQKLVLFHKIQFQPFALTFTHPYKSHFLIFLGVLYQFYFFYFAVSSPTPRNQLEANSSAKKLKKCRLTWLYVDWHSKSAVQIYCLVQVDQGTLRIQLNTLPFHNGSLKKERRVLPTYRRFLRKSLNKISVIQGCSRT